MTIVFALDTILKIAQEDIYGPRTKYRPKLLVAKEEQYYETTFNDGSVSVQEKYAFEQWQKEQLLD